MIIPLDADVFERLLKEAGYNEAETDCIISGFRNGFDIGYKGKVCERTFLPNLKLTLGDEIDLWNKVIKEVKLKRYVGPYELENFPFKNFIQSPIGLVPKDQGRT